MYQPNIIMMTDSYKVSHYKQYPPGATRVMSFFESRGGRYPKVLFFGLQYLIRKYLTGQVVTESKIREAAELFKDHFGSSDMFNEEGWRYILEKHGGRLPIEIKAVPEGSLIPVSNVLVTVENTDPMVPWLTNYIETLLVQLWYPTTVATQSYYMKQTILKHLIKTGTPEEIDFKLHDFGYRGSTSVESAGIGGAAHLVNFKGTDTLEAIQVARHFYGEKMAGFSIPAAEHSTITSWGRENERLAFANMLEQYPTGLVAVVSDSYDIYEACDKLWGTELRDKVLARDGVVVVRPDSGQAMEVLPRVMSILSDRFGSRENSKGYNVINPKVRTIQGDGIDYLSVDTIPEGLAEIGWSTDNIGFGSGGGLLQKMDRDTQKFAFKCCAIEVDGVWRDVYKDPKTDPGKRSKRGRLALVTSSDGVKTVREDNLTPYSNLLKTVFKNGFHLKSESLANIRARASM